MRVLLFLVLVLILAGASLAFVRECSYTEGMGARYHNCDCLGIDWVVYDRTPADGPKRSICIGVIRSVNCFRTMYGPQIDCADY